MVHKKGDTVGHWCDITGSAFPIQVGIDGRLVTAFFCWPFFEFQYLVVVSFLLASLGFLDEMENGSLKYNTSRQPRGFYFRFCSSNNVLFFELTYVNKSLAISVEKLINYISKKVLITQAIDNLFDTYV